jgi:hypothetical protein
VSSHGGTRSPEHLVPGTAPVSSQRLQMPPRHHPPVLDQAVGRVSTGQSTAVTGFQLSAIWPKSSHGRVAAPPNPHRRAGHHRFPAGSFFGGFRTPAQLPGPPLAPSRHPKPCPVAAIDHETTSAKLFATSGPARLRPYNADMTIGPAVPKLSFVVSNKR